MSRIIRENTQTQPIIIHCLACYIGVQGSQDFRKVPNVAEITGTVVHF